MVAILNRLFQQKFIWICSLWCAFSFHLAAQDTVTIFGNDHSWANAKVKVFYFNDFISSQTETVEQFTVSDSGYFNLQFVIPETLLLYIESGSLQGVLYVQPGNSYELNLPQWRQTTRVDSLNPFFEPYKFYFGLKNSHSKELNHLIAEFDYIYEDYLATNFSDIRRRRRGSGVGEMIQFLDSLFAPVDSIAFFKGYKDFKIAKLLHIAYLHDDNYVIRDYFLNRKILYRNPAYFSLFNNLFDNYLEVYMRTKDGAQLGSDIARAKSYGRAMATLKTNLALRNDTLRELVLIKGLRDALYKNTFPKSTLFQTLDSVRLQTNIEFHKIIVDNVVKRAKVFQKGVEPPHFSIVYNDSVVFEFPKKNKRFVLLNFIDIESFEVQKALPQLNILVDKHKEVLDVVSVNLGSSFSKAQDFFERYNYNWPLFNGNVVDGIIELYRIKAYPAYFLIDPDGKMALYPTPTLDNNFEWYFFKILKQRERKQYRNQ